MGGGGVEVVTESSSSLSETSHKLLEAPSTGSSHTGSTNPSQIAPVSVQLHHSNYGSTTNSTSHASTENSELQPEDASSSEAGGIIESPIYSSPRVSSSVATVSSSAPPKVSRKNSRAILPDSTSGQSSPSVERASLLGLSGSSASFPPAVTASTGAASSSPPVSPGNSGSGLRAKLKRLSTLSGSGRSKLPDEEEETRQTNPIFRKFISKDIESYKFVKTLPQHSTSDGNGSEPNPVVKRSRSTGCIIGQTKITRTSPTTSPPMSPRSATSSLAQKAKRRASLPTKLRSRAAAFTLSLNWSTSNKSTTVDAVEAPVIVNPLLEIIHAHIEMDDDLKQVSAALRQALTKLVNYIRLDLALKVAEILETIRLLLDKHVVLAKKKLQMQKPGSRTGARILRHCRRLDVLYKNLSNTIPRKQGTPSFEGNNNNNSSHSEGSPTTSRGPSLRSSGIWENLKDSSRNRRASSFDDWSPQVLRMFTQINKLMASSAKIASLSHRDSSRKLKKIGFSMVGQIAEG